MKIEECFMELEEILEDAWSLPLTKGKAFVDVEKIRDVAEDIRNALPGEWTQAKAIVADRSQIIEDAKKEADTVVKSAEERARVIVSKDELVKQAETRAENIIMEAQAKAREMKKATNDYVDDLMKRTEDALTSHIVELREARKDLKSVSQKS